MAHEPVSEADSVRDDYDRERRENRALWNSSGLPIAAPHTQYCVLAFSLLAMHILTDH